MIRALVIEPAGGLWGSERALLDLLESPHDVHFGVCCPPDTPLAAELALRGATVMPWFVAELHRRPRWERVKAAVGVLRACIKFRPNVIHMNQSGAYRVSLPAALLLNLPVVCHVRIFEDASYLAGVAPRSSSLKAIIAISNSIEAEIRRLKALDRIPVRRVYDAYQPVSLLAGHSNGRPVRVACVGRITPIKGQEVLLAALARVGALPEGAECLMIGDGERSHVERLMMAHPEPVGRRVVWCGFQRDVLPLLQTCKVLVCPSYREPLGRVIFEAWDAGTIPLVFAGSGGAAEIVMAADGGLLYNEQTPECLGRALSQALTLGEAEAKRLVENGRRWMQVNCAPEAYGRTIAQLLTEAAG